MIHFRLSTKTDFPILTDRKGDYFSLGIIWFEKPGNRVKTGGTPVNRATRFRFRFLKYNDRVYTPKNIGARIQLMWGRKGAQF
jgi:hypothetical protein